MYWFRCCCCTTSSIISCLVEQHTTKYYCFCLKRITLSICVCSSPSCRFFATLALNLGKFGAKKYFIEHRTANAIQLFVPTKRKSFGSLLFQNNSQRRGIPQGLLDKYSHLCICISLKWTLSSGQKPLTNTLCCSALLWSSFCFLWVNQ